MPDDPLNRHPFSGIHEMHTAKEAILCALVNPKIKTLLIQGASGTGKTVLARSVASITDREVVNIPLNVTDEQLFGSLDVESLLRDGSVRLNDSVLIRADGNILYLDDAGLLDHRLLKMLLGSVDDGVVRVERNNVSAEYLMGTVLIASMNPLESSLPQTIMDDFDVSVQVYGPKDPDIRIRIAEENITYRDGQSLFGPSNGIGEIDIRLDISAARALLPKVAIPTMLMRAISMLARKYRVQGYRGELATINVSLALAALDGRMEVSESDVEKAALMCIYHRKRRPKDRTKEECESKDKYGNTGESMLIDVIRRSDAYREKGNEDATDDEAACFGTDADPIIVSEEDLVMRVGDSFDAIDVIAEIDKGTYAERRSIRSLNSRGKSVGEEEYQGGILDLAVGATVRAAAPFQHRREKESASDMAVIIEMKDVRNRVRHELRRRTLLFVIDASGSLIIGSRMTNVKASVMSMLEKLHSRRDRVGIVRFSEGDTELIMPPTKHVESVAEVLANLSIGDRTPLSEGLMFTYEYMLSYTRKHPEEECYAIVITDGRANIPLREGADPIDEALELADKMRMPGLKWIVIDTGIGYSKNDVPESLSRRLDAKYYTLDDLKDN
jgi:magnesium chelatase subunit D